MRAEAKPRRRIWPWILIAILAISATIIGVSIANGTWGNNGTPTATPTDVVSPSANAQPSGQEPTGCLGGSARDGAMVLAAQAAAPQDQVGAIEVATAFVRWLNQYPYPSSADIAMVEESGISMTAPTQDIQEFFDSEPNLSGGLVEDGVTYYLSTVPGVYNVETATSDEVSVSIGTALVIDGALSPTLKGSIAVLVAWEDGAWKFVSSEGTRTTEDLYAIGQPFTAGC